MLKTPAVRIAKGSTYLLSSNIANTIISIATFPLIARLLTLEEMGATVALSLVLSLSQLLSELGFNNGISKYIAGSI